MSTGRIVTVPDMAGMLGLKKHSTSRAFCGPNPWGEGATEDGFLLWPEGNATDAQSPKGYYTCPEVAEMAGVEKTEYEPYIRFMEAQNQPNFQPNVIIGSSSGKSTVITPQKPEKVYNSKTLEERGIRPETLEYFKITFKREAYHYPTWCPNGDLGRARVKYLDPKKAFPNNKKNPPKYTWKGGDSDPMPPAYNLNNIPAYKVMYGDHIFLVNGEPSVWVCHQAGVPAVAPFGEGRNAGYKVLMSQLHELEIKKVYVCLDNDKTGKYGALRAKEAAAEFEIECVIKRMPDKGQGYDVGDFYEQCEFNDDVFKAALDSLPSITADEFDDWVKEEDQEVKEEKAEKAEKEKAKKDSPATQLVDMIKAEAQLICGADGSFYACTDRVDRTEFFQISDGDFGLYLRYLWMKEKGTSLNREDISNAIENMKSIALFDDSGRKRPKQEVFVRTGFDNQNNLFFDLCDDECRVVQITPDGEWFITQKPGVPFRRAKGMEPLPVPQRGGSIEDFRALVNCQDEAQWIKLASWMIYSMRAPLGSYPVLSIHGGRGSAKSTACRMVKGVIDPNYTPFVGTSGVDERQLAITAKNSYALAFDNLTGMPSWMNSVLCSLATEASFRHRMLRTDDDEMLFKARRPIIINAIEESIGAEDFRNRCVPVYLQAIDEKKKIGDETMKANLQKALPIILGAFLDILAYGHSTLPQTKIDRAPRMEDFARFIVSCEDACPWKNGTFLPLIMETSIETDSVAAENNIVAVVILELMERRSIYEGTPKALWLALNAQAEPSYKQSRYWPQSPQAVIGKLANIEANLKVKGLHIEGISSRERLKGTGNIKITKEGYHASSLD